MGAIQVKNVPEDLHQALRDRAKNEGQSVGEYVLRVLRRDLALPTMHEWLQRVAEDAPMEDFDAAELIRQGREERDRELAERLRRS